jgi:GntR family transcriptional regulator, transcriptional repressor for pyruvate dehydrogenase complex
VWEGGQVAGANARNASREVPQRIADELRVLIVSGELSEGESLGREPDLVERFGVSRPSLREALRILEAEGLITVERGVRGGVVAHEPDQRMTARTAALVLRSRNVSLADVFEARSLLEPVAARKIATMPARARRAVVAQLSALIDAEEEAIGTPEAFAVVNTKFHERLVAEAGNQTLSIVIEMLNEIVTRAVTAVSEAGDAPGSLSTRQRGIRSQRRLMVLLEEGVAAAAEEHWRAHMAVVAKVMLGHEASTAIELFHHYG